MARGLGSGLGALFGDDLVNEPEGGMVLPVSKLEPRMDQPRSNFDEESLAELADSIREHGMIQPITVRRLDGGYYQIIAGERRWRAARMAGLEDVPVRVMEADDQESEELALIENLQREDLNPIEEARGYRQLMSKYGMTQEKVSERVGKSRPVIANALRLLNLPPEVIKLVEEQKLTLSHARAILELESPRQQTELATKTVSEGLSVRETTRQVKRMTDPKPPAKPKRRTAPDGVDYMAEVEKELGSALGRRVRVRGGETRGVFEIEYYGADDFEALYNALKSMGGSIN